jgi:Flp pilus assembly protein TadG
MKTKYTVRNLLYFFRYPKNSTSLIRSKGQALVEFTLCFILLLVIIWIPADFGLAFMTGQLMSNAAREGARIGSAAIPFVVSDIETETCRRLPSALLGDPGGTGVSCGSWSRAKVLVTAPSGVGCNQTVTVRVTGSYNFSFYRILNMMNLAANTDPRTLIRQTTMRWEHQC